MALKSAVWVPRTSSVAEVDGGAVADARQRDVERLRGSGGSQWDDECCTLAAEDAANNCSDCGAHGCNFVQLYADA